MKADEIAARRTLVATAILEHKSQREVAVELGIPRATVCRDIKAIRVEWQSERQAAAEEAAAEDLKRFAEIERMLWPSVLKGDLPALDRWVKIRQERAKLLGIDAPTKVDLTAFLRQAAEDRGLDPDEAVREAEYLTRSFNG